MTIKRKKQKGNSDVEKNQVKSQATSVEKLSGTNVIIRHHQTIRQSENYQSAEVSYGVELTVLDSDKSIADGIERAEDIVEVAVVSKAKEHRTLLQHLS